MLVNKYYLTTDLRIPRTIKVKNKVTGEIENREIGGNFRIGILYVDANGMTRRRFTSLIVTPPKTRLIETWLRYLDAIEKRTQLNPELQYKLLMLFTHYNRGFFFTWKIQRKAKKGRIEKKKKV